MKKVFVLLLLIQVICLTSLAADTATFDGSRNVLIAVRHKIIMRLIT